MHRRQQRDAGVVFGWSGTGGEGACDVNGEG
jgi:hypothetical protein